MSEKLQKVLARAGHGSRREIESIIEAGRVSVDGKIAKLGDRVEVTPGLKIRIDGHLISVRESAELDGFKGCRTIFQLHATTQITQFRVVNLTKYTHGIFTFNFTAWVH